MIDGVRSTITGVAATTADGIYAIGDVIDITIGFSEVVVVSGTPTLQLETGSTDRYATYTSGSGSSNLTFQYTVQAGDSSTDLDQLSSTALTLKGGSITDAAGNSAVLTLADPGETGSLSANADLIIDTTRPTGSLGSFATDPAYTREGENRPFGITDVGWYASPTFADIDGDGDLDLFVGEAYGNTLFFRNTAAPDATTPAYTKEGKDEPFGIPDLRTSSNYGFPNPALADIDGDGDLDLFIGRYHGDTLFFRNTAASGATTPAYTQEGGNEPFGITNLGVNYAKPALADIDVDGDLDLFIGHHLGNTLFFRNTAALGTTTPAYSREGGDEPFAITDVGFSASPSFTDVDGDGDLDLFIGNDSGNTRFFRNTGSASAPAYTQEGGDEPFGIADVGYYAIPSFADIDDDGDLDLFVGEAFGNTLFFRNTAPTPVAPVDSATADGTYGIGDVINLTVGFSENVVVDTSDLIIETTRPTTPQLETGTTDRYAVYTSGSGRSQSALSTLTFQYTIQVLIW